jgi:FkbM family methyltransferase
MYKKLIHYLKLFIKSENKTYHIKRISLSWYYTLININQLRKLNGLNSYFVSKQYKMNTWTLSQSVEYGKDFVKIYNSKNFLSDFQALLVGLDKNSEKEIKFILARMIFLSFLKEKELFSKSEQKTLKIEVELINSVKKENGYYSLMDYKFINNNMTIHNFIDDLGLKTLEEGQCPRTKDIIDVGAYIGDSALILSKYTTKKVYAFEPFLDGFKELNNNIELNKNNNIVPVNLGISNRTGTEKLYFGDGLSISTNDSDTSLSKGACTNIVEINITTIDSYSEEHNLDIGIIKIDAEGAEPKVLQGAINTIKRQKPIILLSIYHNINDFMYLKPWLDKLQLGYKYKFTKPEATTFIEETMLVCYVN